jgi:hypothetical protein
MSASRALAMSRGEADVREIEDLSAGLAFNDKPLQLRHPNRTWRLATTCAVRAAQDRLVSCSHPTWLPF